VWPVGTTAIQPLSGEGQHYNSDIVLPQSILTMMTQQVKPTDSAQYAAANHKKIGLAKLPGSSENSAS